MSHDIVDNLRLGPGQSRGLVVASRVENSRGAESRPREDADVLVGDQEGDGRPR